MPCLVGRLASRCSRKALPAHPLPPLCAGTVQLLLQQGARCVWGGLGVLRLQSWCPNLAGTCCSLGTHDLRTGPGVQLGRWQSPLQN